LAENDQTYCHSFSETYPSAVTQAFAYVMAECLGSQNFVGHLAVC